MTKEQAKKEALAIIEDYSKKCDLIVKEAKENGTWLMGLDSNNGLFKEAKKEAKEKLKALASKVDK